MIPTKLLPSILLLCILGIASQLNAQQIFEYDFEQTVYDGKSNPRYKVKYQVIADEENSYVLSEYADMAYETIADEAYLHYKSPADGTYKKVWIPRGKAKIEATGEFKTIAGIECQKYDIKFDRVNGYIYCAQTDSPKFGYYVFDKLDYYFRRVQAAWTPENLPGAVLGYSLKIPFVGVCVGELVSYRKSSVEEIPAYNVAAQMVSVKEYVQTFKDFRNGKFMQSIEVGQEAPSFSGVMLDGASLDLQQMKGKVVFINFWAIWCGGCVAEIPELNDLSEKFKDDEILFVALTEDQKANVKGYLEEKPFHFQQLANMSHIANEYGARPIPRSVLIGKNGKIAAIFDWPLAPQFGEEKLAVEKAKVIAAIDAALAK